MIKLFEHIKDLTPKVATIGFFDGVHLGHDFLLNQLKSYAVNHDLCSMVITFSNHPRLFFEPDCGLQQLTLSDEKIQIIENKGVNYTLLLNFTLQIANLTSSQFMQMLSEQYGVTTLLVGYDHHFGSDTSSTYEQYVEYGRNFNVKVIRCIQHKEHDLTVSSSKIRNALSSCNVSLANELLGYYYSISGQVVHGQQIGRKIGFPTANIKVDSLKLLPAKGVYAVKVYLGSNIYKGVLNIGTRPTVDGKDQTVEVHIVGFEGDIYEEKVKIEFIDFIRHEQKFTSLDALKCQIKNDIKSVNF